MNDVNEYLANVPEAKRVELERIRSIVKELVPDAEESISYAMPTFKYGGRPLVYYAAFKDHLSIFPAGATSEAFAKELRGFKQSKGTIQFTETNPLSDELIKKIVRFRLDKILNS